MNTFTLKENIKNYYNQEAELRNSKSIRQDFKIRERAKFFNLIKQENKKSLLELGAGAGYDSLFFMNCGLTVTAVDISSEMVKNCREKGINAYELDYYNISSLDRKFECVFAMNTLLHIPKLDLNHVLNEISTVIEPEGLFYIGLYGGKDTEGEHINSEVSDIPRFFAFHSENYLKMILLKHFKIVKFETIKIDAYGSIDGFHSIVLKK